MKFHISLWTFEVLRKQMQKMIQAAQTETRCLYPGMVLRFYVIRNRIFESRGAAQAEAKE